MSQVSTGKCACGAVSYTVEGPLRDVHNCHCNWCRRTSGHFIASTRAVRSDLKLDGGDSLQWWSPNGIYRYGFCSICGGTVFWETSGSPDLIWITAGTLDKPTGLTTTDAYFTDYASDYHRLDDTIEGAAFSE